MTAETTATTALKPFRMPSLGADMDAGTLVEWLKQPGEPVHHGDIIAVVETQKGAIEVEIFDEGVVDKLLMDPGARVPVGTPLALIATARGAARVGAGEPAVAFTGPGAAPPVETGQKPPPEIPPERQPERPPPERPPELPPERPPEVPPEMPPEVPSEAPPEAPPPEALSPEALSPEALSPEALAPETLSRASPAARKLAAARGIDLAGIAGSGPGGAVVYADVVARKPEPAPAPARRRGIDTAEMRRAIAAAMARSKREIPHYYLGATVDAGRALEWLADTNAARTPPERLLPAVLLLKATALALAKTPELNGFFVDGQFRPGPGIHLGTAIAIRGGGLVAPAIHDVDAKSLDEIMAALTDLVARVRGGGLRSSELADPTLTVTNLGERGVEQVFGVIYPPQVAIVGFGRIAERPWVVGGEVVARPLLNVTLAADHRVSDGHRGALFLAEIDRLLQNPEAL